MNNEASNTDDTRRTILFSVAAALYLYQLFGCKEWQSQQLYKSKKKQSTKPASHYQRSTRCTEGVSISNTYTSPSFQYVCTKKAELRVSRVATIDAPCHPTRSIQYLRNVLNLVIFLVKCWVPNESSSPCEWHGTHTYTVIRPLEVRGSISKVKQLLDLRVMVLL